MGEATIYGNKLPESLNYFKVAPYARFSFAKWDKVSLFLDGGFGFKFYNKERGSQFNVGINPGIAFTPTEKISLVARFGGIGYQKDSEKVTVLSSVSAWTTRLTSVFTTTSKKYLI